MNIFEKATKYRIRFDTTMGTLNTEDLWDLTLHGLDEIFRELDTQYEQYSKKTLAKDKENPNKEQLELRINIIKHIYSAKEKEEELANERLKNKQLKEKLLEIKYEKQNDKYKEMSEEELDKELAKLE